MKITAIAAGLALVFGMYSGIKIAETRHNKAMAKTVAEIEAARAEKQEQLAILSKEYYEQFEAISNRDPVTVERRVFVKADCVPTGAGPRVGNAAHAGGSEIDRAADGSVGKVELAPETVQTVVGVADRAERLYQQCATRLKYFQDRHER